MSMTRRAGADCLCKVWDRRALKGGKPVGVLVGHLEGITHVSSKRDGRYLITNSKDQSIKVAAVPPHAPPPFPLLLLRKGGLQLSRVGEISNSSCA